MATLNPNIDNFDRIKSYYLENYFYGNYVYIYYKNYFHEYNIPFCTLISKYTKPETEIKINNGDYDIDDVVKNHTIEIDKIYYNENENKPENDLFEIPNCAISYSRYYFNLSKHKFYGYKYDNNICIFDSNNKKKDYLIIKKLLDKLYEDKKLYYINNKQKIPENIKRFNVICYPTNDKSDSFISKINFIDHNYHCVIIGLVMFDIFTKYYMDKKNSKFKTKENIINFMKNILKNIKEYFLSLTTKSFDNYIDNMYIRMNMFEYNQYFDINNQLIDKEKMLVLSGKTVNNWYDEHNMLIINLKENLKYYDITNIINYITNEHDGYTKYEWPDNIKTMQIINNGDNILNIINYNENNIINHFYPMNNQYRNQIYIRNINNIESIKFEDLPLKNYKYYEKQLLFKPNFYKFEFNIDKKFTESKKNRCVKSSIICDNLNLIPKINYTTCNLEYIDFFLENSNQIKENYHFKLSYNERFQNLNIYYTFIDLLLNDECKILMYIGRNINDKYYENYLKIEKYYKECISYFRNYVKTLILNTAQKNYLNPYYKNLKINKNNNKEFIENIEKYYYFSASEIYKKINNSKNIINNIEQYVHIEKISNDDKEDYYKEYKKILEEYNIAKEYFKSIGLDDDLDILYYKHVSTNIIKKDIILSNEDKYKIYLSNYDIIKVTNCDIVNIDDIDENIRMYLNKY